MEISLNEITFSLPCRRFIIDYSVTEKRSFPVVKEFVLRFLFNIQTCPPKIVFDFFGFTASEQSEVLLDLEKEKLIIWRGEEIAISDYAKTLFEKKDGELIPRLFEVTDKSDSVEFELLSLKLITQKGYTEQVFNAVEVPLPPEYLQNIQKKIRTSFDKQFTTYIEEIKGVDIFSDPEELYKITGIRSKKDRMLPIEVDIKIDSKNTRGPIIKYLDKSIEKLDDKRKIWSFINEYIKEDYFPPSEQKFSLLEYLKCTKDPVLSEQYENDEIDILSLIKKYHENDGYVSEDCRMLVGNIYMKHNSDKIFELLDGKYGEKNKIPALGVLWSTWADGQLWGRSSTFIDFTKKVKSRIDGRYKPGEIVLCMSFDSDGPEDWNFIYSIKNIFSYNNTNLYLQGMDVPFCNTQCELFYIPEILVACLFHVEDNNFGNQTIPLGFVSTNEQLISNIKRSIYDWTKDKDTFNHIFERRGTPPSETVFNNYLQPLIKYEQGET